MGLTVLDAGVIIAVLDARDAHHLAAIAALREVLDSEAQLVIPASAYAEALVSPSRKGSEAVAVLDAFLDGLPAVVAPATREIARSAASLRARHGTRLRLPDALVLATANVLGAGLVLTTDARWPAAGLKVRVLRNG